MEYSFIPLAIPFLDEQDAQAVYECVKTTFVSSVGPLVGKFEEYIAKYTGALKAVAASSGTTALTLGLKALDIKQGDIVIAPDFTFVATVNPALHLGADIVLVDPDEETMNPSIDRILESIEYLKKKNHKPKAVLFVHLYGVLGNLEKLLEPLRSLDIHLIEDAAEALGATWNNGVLKNKHAGTGGTFGILSFNGNKVITSGGGGMVLTDDENLAVLMKHLSTQARLPGIEYVHDHVGYNFRLTNLQAALGLSQLSKINKFLTKKHEIRKTYDEAFSEIKGLILHPSPSWANGSDWLYTIRVPKGVNVKAVIDELRVRKIEARPVWTPLHMQQPYKGFKYIGSGVSEELHARAMSLPSSVGLTKEEQDRVINEVMDILYNYLK